MTGAEYLAFLGAAVILTLTPGPDTFLTLRFGARGLRAGIVYTAAVTIGIVAWAVLTLTGIAALLETYPGLRVGITLLGGSYLVYLGARAIVPVIRRRRAGLAAPPTLAVGAGPGGSVFGTGLISSLTNPKTGLFFLAMLPPFLPRSPDVLDRGLLVATVAGCIFVYGVGLSAVADRAGRLLSSGSGADAIDLVSGTILLALGVTIIAL